MVSNKKLLDEIENWAAESNSVIFRHVGQRLNDSGSLGFVSPQFTKHEDSDADTIVGKDFFDKRFDGFCSAWPSVDASSEVKFAYFLADMIKPHASPAPIAPLAVLTAREIIARAKKGAKVILGVTEERSDLVEDGKLESGKLPVIFEGTLDRDAMARALDAAMEQKGLSVRKAADAAGTSAGIISSVRDQRASLDKAVEVLDKLGFVAEISVRPKDHS